ncbi:2-succinyl-5-enolpyruvyl-6-hydroxy-3-cyclohexene-1-carboxylic-acid synthase [Nocardia sp. NPDC055321]
MIQAGIVVDELIRCGVREAVLCPGARNAPLSFALFRADAEHRLRLHVRIDERSAAFLAVGLAVGGDHLVAVVTTSGTAVANLLPAVLEAGYSNVPLLIISANRPLELVGTGANQTITQPGIFGDATRIALVLNQADQHYDATGERLAAHNARWRAAVCRVAAAALGRRDGAPGPAHLDIPFAEPLIGSGTTTTVPGRPGSAPWTDVVQSSLDAPATVDLRPDTLVIAGHGAPESPALAGVPTIAEPSAPQPAPRYAVHPLALPHLQPEQVIVLGRPTLHRSVARLLAAPSVRVITAAADRNWTDVAGTATVAARHIRTVGAPTRAWTETCRDTTDIAAAAVDRMLDDTARTTGLHVARAVTRALRGGDTLVLGSSNPIRDVSLTWRRDARVRVVSNRGVAGIDGLVSMSIGAALTGRRTVALLGDLTFAHDSGGLLIGPSEPTPHDLTIVVANDNGGGIFGLLEQGAPQFATVFERVFGTPHGTDLAKLCAAHGVPHATADTGDLGGALRDGGRGVRVVEVQTARDGLRELHAAIRSEVDSGLCAEARQTAVQRTSE